MATLKLSALEARPGPNGTVHVILNVGKLDTISPPKQVEIKTAADAERALAEYAATVAVPACVSGHLAKGDRAPPGFRKLRLTTFVNL